MYLIKFFVLVELQTRRQQQSHFLRRASPSRGRSPPLSQPGSVCCFAFVCVIVQKGQKIKEQSSSSKSSFLSLAFSLKSTSLSVSIYLGLSQRERIEYPEQLKQQHRDKSQTCHHRYILKLTAGDYRSWPPMVQLQTRPRICDWNPCNAYFYRKHNIVIDDVRNGDNQDPAHHLHCTCVLPLPFPLSSTLVHFCQDQHFSLLIWTGELLFIMLMLSCLLNGLTCWLWFVLRYLIFCTTMFSLLSENKENLM